VGGGVGRSGRALQNGRASFDRLRMRRSENGIRMRKSKDGI
jgi:hypothetical protein